MGIKWTEKSGALPRFFIDRIEINDVLDII